MAPPTFTTSTRPVNDDEAQTHDHEEDSEASKAGSQNLGCGLHRLLLLGHDTDVKDGWEDEDQAWCWCGSDDAEDTKDGGRKDDQQIDDSEKDDGDNYMAQPSEWLVLE